jgi:hypothetical protein
MCLTCLPCFGRHVKSLVPAALQSLALTNPHWVRVVGYGLFSLRVIHKEGLCPSSGHINRLMMMMMMVVSSRNFVRVKFVVICRWFSCFLRHQLRNENGLIGYTRPASASQGCELTLQYFSIILLMLYTYKPFSLITLSILKNPHVNPLGSFKDLSIHRDGQREATFVLYYVMNSILWTFV